MEKEFIPYEQAVALKELGFDEKCLSCYLYEVETFSWELNYQISNNSIPWIISAPIYQQASRWFREKYNLQCSINFYSESLGIKKVPNHYEIQIDYLSNNKWCYFENINNKIYLTYEEAELECLKKLIDIQTNEG